MRSWLDWTAPTRAAKTERVTLRRLALAFAVAPLGAMLFLTALFSRGMDTPMEWFTGGPKPLFGWAIMFGIAYAAGAVLLPFFFLLEYFGKRSGIFYVPIAAVAGVLLGLLLDGPESVRQNAVLSLLCAGAGAASAVVFSAVLAVRPNRRLQPAADATASRRG